MMSQWLWATTEGALLEEDAGSIVSDRSNGFERKRRWCGKRLTMVVVGKATITADRAVTKALSSPSKERQQQLRRTEGEAEEASGVGVESAKVVCGTRWQRGVVKQDGSDRLSNKMALTIEAGGIG
ncbi:hypothetical protein B296_00010647 [Ensete ventricosum]|uniref:Uncharacterized protein n=1 Tax=Ensete ventricosum TaxID=4639 RepID=A0A427AJ26_ENSVE|nr:hypothetical protein B296_00010647 [Ensete ventricosum]